MYFESTGTLGELISYRYFYDRAEMERRKQMLDRFSYDFKDTNRQVFIDTYTNYYFTREYGLQPGAERILQPVLLAALNRVHRAREQGEFLSLPERRDVFATALTWEQEMSVGPRVAEAVKKFNCPILKALALKPVVRFRYFPKATVFFFRDFSDRFERTEYAMKSFDLAEQAGWDQVVAAMYEYGVRL
jgi:hypothetical protein